MRLDADELQALFQRCAAARKRFLELAVQGLVRDRILDQAKRLGLPLGQEMAQVGEADLAFALDLAVHAAPPGRSTAMGRVAARHARLEGEPALVLNGLSHAWVSVFRVLGPHPVLGLVLEDIFRGGEVWVLDEVLAEVSDPGAILVARMGRVWGFAMTSGVVAALDEGVLDGIRRMVAATGASAEDVLDEPRFLQAMWRRAMGLGVGGGFDPD